MKKAGQKNTVEVSVGELSKLPVTVKVSVSVGWLNKYNQFASQMGMTPLATDGEDSPEISDTPTKGGVGNITVG